MFLHKSITSGYHWWILICFNVCYGFYLPGLAPVNYCTRESEASPQCKVSEILVEVEKQSIRSSYCLCE